MCIESQHNTTTLKKKKLEATLPRRQLEVPQRLLTSTQENFHRMGGAVITPQELYKSKWQHNQVALKFYTRPAPPPGWLTYSPSLPRVVSICLTIQRYATRLAAEPGDPVRSPAQSHLSPCKQFSLGIQTR